MKLDGEKLLADLEYQSEWLEKQLEIYGSAHGHNLRLSEANLWKKAIKSGDYTIEDKG